MILLTGATGTIGRPLLDRLLAAGHDVRCLVRDPRRLGPQRVQVQIAINDLAGNEPLDRVMRGVKTVVHLAATTHDQARGTIEQVGGIATLRLLGAARRANVERIVQVIPTGASTVSPSRVIRTQALAAEAVRASGLELLQFEAGIVYAPGDPWIGRVEQLSRLPLMPVPGDGKAAFEPIWAEDAADAIAGAMAAGIATPGAPITLAGPDVMTQNQILRLVMRHLGRQRPLVHVPRPLVRRLLSWQERRAGVATFATWDQVELLQQGALSANGTRDLEALGIDPLPMADVMPLR